MRKSQSIFDKTLMFIMLYGFSIFLVCAPILTATWFSSNGNIDNPLIYYFVIPSFIAAFFGGYLFVKISAHLNR